VVLGLTFRREKKNGFLEAMGTARVVNEGNGTNGLGWNGGDLLAAC
jgi:hypothetical protein